MSFPVMKGNAYTLIYTPSLLVGMGTTQTSERRANPNSEYLQQIPEHLRTYEECVAYAPNQVYIGNMHPEFLNTVAKPMWQKENLLANASRDGKYGENMPEAEFLGMIKIVDSFDPVSYTHLRAHETRHDLVCRLLLEK